MRILFIAEPYMNLHLPIIDEMRRQGHEVVFLEDEKLDFDWRLPWISWKQKPYLLMKSKVFRLWPNYWRKRIQQNQHLFDKPFDILFAVNGRSLHKTFFEYLKHHSPAIKSFLYLWDNSKFYNYFRNSTYFDRIATYDYLDSKEFGVELLPFYWTPNSSTTNSPSHQDSYLLSIVGSNHSGRLTLCNKIYDTLIKTGLRSEDLCFRILDTTKPASEIVMNSSLSVSETMEIINHSTCILDTDRPSQSGTTPRLIWSLAKGKKIITTNIYIKNFPFYDPKQILIINRENPVIPISFITEPLPADYETPDIVNLRIDNWVRQWLN